MLRNIMVAVVWSLSHVQLNIMVILTQIWISDNHPNIHDAEPTTPPRSPVVSGPTPLLETGSPAPKTWRGVDLRRPGSSGQLLPGVGGIGAGDGSRHVFLWACQKDTFSGPKFIHSESIPSGPESCCLEKKKKKPRQQVECGGGKEAGREDRRAGAREGQRG